MRSFFGGSRNALWAAILIQSNFFIALGAVAAGSPTPVWRMVAIAVCAHIPYVAALVALWLERDRAWLAWKVVLASLGLRLLLVSAPPVFSDDVYRYVWDGRVVCSGRNPYDLPPESIELAALRDESWNMINNKPLRTIYPPLSQAFFGTVASVAPHAWAFKLASALADAAVVWLIIVLAGGLLRGSKEETSSGRRREAIFAGACYGFNPLACIESGMSGHIEPLAVLGALLALLLLKQGRTVWSALAVIAAAGIKIVPILLLPLIARRDSRAWLAAAAFAVAIWLPFGAAGLRTIETFDAFSRRWEGNSGLFSLVKFGAEKTIGFAAGANEPEDAVHFRFLDPLARSLQGSFFSLHKESAFDPNAPGSFPLLDLSLAAAKLVLGLALVAVIAAVTIKRLDPLASAAWIFGALLIFTPVLHPWYALWILPLAAVLRLWPWFVLGALLPLSYLPLEDWWAKGVWVMPAWALWTEYGIFSLSALAYAALSMRSRASNLRS